MGDLLILRFRGRLFGHSETVPGTALIAILMAIPYSVKCLMSYIRVEAHAKSA
jgi:hypothetical protein